MKIKKMKIKVSDYFIDSEIAIKEASRFNILIIHGASNDMHYPLLENIFNNLAENYTVMRFNFSFVKGKKPQIRRNLNETEACIKVLGHKNLILIGKSYGGHISILETLRHSDKVLKSIILGYSIHEENNPSNVNNKMIWRFKGIKNKLFFIIGDKDKMCNIKIFKKNLPYIKYRTVRGSHSFKNDRNKITHANFMLVNKLILMEISNLEE
jgi:predicted alpha/beta-hydrolase family hydrolase